MKVIHFRVIIGCTRYFSLQTQSIVPGENGENLGVGHKLKNSEYFEVRIWTEDTLSAQFSTHGAAPV
jgi:hypothetical protein